MGKLYFRLAGNERYSSRGEESLMLDICLLSFSSIIGRYNNSCTRIRSIEGSKQTVGYALVSVCFRRQVRKPREEATRFETSREARFARTAASDFIFHTEEGDCCSIALPDARARIFWRGCRSSGAHSRLARVTRPTSKARAPKLLHSRVMIRTVQVLTLAAGGPKYPYAGVTPDVFRRVIRIDRRESAPRGGGYRLEYHPPRTVTFPWEDRRSRDHFWQTYGPPSSRRGQATEAQFEKGNEPEKEIESEKRTGRRQHQGERERGRRAR